MQLVPQNWMLQFAQCWWVSLESFVWPPEAVFKSQIYNNRDAQKERVPVTRVTWMDCRFVQLFFFFNYLLLLKHLSRRISGFQNAYRSTLSQISWNYKMIGGGYCFTPLSVNNNFQLKTKSLFKKKKKKTIWNILPGLNCQMPLLNYLCQKLFIC